MWICNGCRHRPCSAKINDRNIESEKSEDRPNLTRQTSEHSDRAADQAKFRINQINPSKKTQKEQQQQQHCHKGATKRSRPWATADSGIASLARRSKLPVNCPKKQSSIDTRLHPAPATHAHAYSQPRRGIHGQRGSRTRTKVTDAPERHKSGKRETKETALPRNPSLGSECDYLPFEH